VSGVANAQALKLTIEGVIRTGRSGAPPVSSRSNRSVSVVERPAARFAPKSIRRFV
jgi:hypothetical protein